MDLTGEKDKSIQQFARCLQQLSERYSYEGFSFQRMDEWRNQIHAAYPLLFVEAFKEKLGLDDISALGKLNLAGNLYYWHLILSDQIVDDLNEESTLERMLLLRDLQRNAIKILCELFPGHSEFWNYFEGYEHQLATALLKERRNHWGVFRPYSQGEFAEIATGKACVAKPFVAALAMWFENRELLQPLSHSHDLFHISFQLADDLKDWRKDYEARQYSFILSQVIQSHQLESEVNSDARPEAEIIGKMLYYSGAAEQALDICLEYLEKALQSVEGIRCPEWKQAIENRQKKYTNDKLMIEGARKENMAKLGISPS